MYMHVHMGIHPESIIYHTIPYQHPWKVIEFLVYIIMSFDGCTAAAAPPRVPAYRCVKAQQRRTGMHDNNTAILPSLCMSWQGVA